MIPPQLHSQFIEVASARLRRALAALFTEPATVARELHGLAGDAGMLGFKEISKAAGEGSKIATAWKTMPPTSEQQLASARLLRSLMMQVAKLDHPSGPARRATGAASRHALVIDDSKLVAEELADGMLGAGFSTSIASTEEQVVAAIRERIPEFVLLDANIPGVESRVVCETVRRHAPAAKVILVSGAAEGELQELARTLGADASVSKLQGLARVISKVQEVLGSGA